MDTEWLVFCSGGCGRRLKRGSTALPKPTCRRCRRRRSLLFCGYCNMPFRPLDGNIQQEYCCVKHAALGREQNKRLEKLEEAERLRRSSGVFRSFG